LGSSQIDLGARQVEAKASLLSSGTGGAVGWGMRIVRTLVLVISAGLWACGGSEPGPEAVVPSALERWPAACEGAGPGQRCECEMFCAEGTVSCSGCASNQRCGRWAFIDTCVGGFLE
jgi:hypothetical protein